MQAIIFIVRAIVEVLLVTAFILRIVLPLARADARNPFTQAVIRLTNPIVLPLRRILPPIGRTDTASVVALLLVQSAATAILWLLGAYPIAVLTGLVFAQIVILSIIVSVLQLYVFALFLYGLLSWIAPGAYSPGAELLGRLCEPVLRPIRRLIPPFGGLDMSVFFAIVIIWALRIWIGTSSFVT
jgi:YggT family protein